MSDTHSPNAAEVQYWNSATTQAWADRHEPIDKMFADLTQFAMGQAAPQSGERVIDLGCGSGTTVLELAQRVGPNGFVLGADVSERSVARARERIADAGIGHVDVIVADVSTYGFDPNSFDLAFSRFGVMFFSDPAATFANIRNAIRAGGRLCLGVFRTQQENRWAIEPLAAVRDLITPPSAPGPEEPGQFSWADPARVQRILKSAGFHEIALTPHDPQMMLGINAAEAADFAMTIGPIARASRGVLNEQRAIVRERLEAFFKRHESSGGVVLPGAIWIVRATA